MTPKDLSIIQRYSVAGRRELLPSCARRRLNFHENIDPAKRETETAGKAAKTVLVGAHARRVLVLARSEGESRLLEDN